MSVKYWL